MKKIAAILMVLVLCAAMVSAVADTNVHFAVDPTWTYDSSSESDMGAFGKAATNFYTNTKGVSIMTMEIDMLTAIANAGYMTSAQADMLRGNDNASLIFPLMTTDESYANVSDVMYLPNGIAYVTFDFMNVLPSVIAYDNGSILMVVATDLTVSYNDLISGISLK